uniref:Methyltransferase domain-containing protein n=1 Tax=Panagrolaimus sp. ES5 TaxID=591445 RepID=A0AC34F565_9BILA
MENRLKEIAFNGALSLSLSFGHELGLFNALAAVGTKEEPANASQLAEKTGIDLEFATVWLNGMVSGKIIERNASGDKFWIENENLSALTGEEPAAGLVYNRLLPMFSSHYKQAVEMAKEKPDDKKPDEKEKEKEHTLGEGHQHGHSHNHGHGHGGHGDNHGEAFPLMELLSKTTYRKHLIPDFLPLTGLREKLEKGGMEILDVGCGTGFHICEFAREFPNCNFTGIDISSNAIKRAQEVAKEMKLSNVKFEVISGEKMPDEWTNRYDWIFSWNSIHDHKNPKIAINEINRVLNKDGRYTMLEMNKPGNPNDYGTTPMSMFWAVAGLFIVLPVRRAPEVFKWTNAAAVEMLKESGFKNVEPVKTPFYDFNILFVCKK